MDGVRFDSRAEAERYAELALMQRAGEIRDLRRQVRIRLIAPFRHKVFGRQRGLDYIGDFAYTDCATGRSILEDVKGVRTKGYLIKRTLLLWRYPDLEFREIEVRGKR